MNHVLVIGAGIAGPALALFLEKSGISSAVYEAYPDSHGIGGGLSLAPNGMNVLFALGLADRVRALGTTALENCARSQNGRVLARWDNGSTAYGQPAVNLRRSDLHEVLASEGKRRGIPLFYGKRLSRIAQSETGVIAEFADGTIAEGDILIAADGVRSTVRSTLFPEAPAPKYVGLIGVGGFTPLSSLPSICDRDRHTLTFTMGQRGFFGYGGARPGEMMWWSNIWREREFSTAELKELSTDNVKRELLERYGNYHAPIPSLLEQSGPAVKLNIYDIPSLPAWSRDRVMLIGDASHAVSPNAGQGASMALEDAMLLAKYMRDTQFDYRRAFEQFEHDRRPRVERIVAEGRRRGLGKKDVNRFEAAVRDLVAAAILKLFAERGQDSLYRYRIDW